MTFGLAVDLTLRHWFSFMPNRRMLRLCVSVTTLCTAAYGQLPAPIGDRVDEALLPSGISNHDVDLEGSLAFLFKDDDGTDVAHYLGGFTLRTGEDGAQALRSKEAVVWISHRIHEGRPYQHLQILLWRDAEIVELGGTTTFGPALFVTLNTFASIRTHVDDVAYQSSADREVYKEGNAIRKAIAGADIEPASADTSLRVLDPTGLTTESKKPPRRSTMIFQVPSGEFRMQRIDGRDVVTVVGGAYMARGEQDSSGYLEILADSVVVFLPRNEDAETGSSGPASRSRGGLGGKPDENGKGPRNSKSQRTRRSNTNPQMMSGPFGENLEVEGVYLEGDVRMSQGPVSIRASRLYYDLLNEKALILDAVLHAKLADRNVPLYVRAVQIRQLSADRFSAEDAILTTSEFHTPHYHIGASRIDLVNRTPAEPGAAPGTIRAGSFTIKDATFNMSGRPVLWWPFMRGTVDTSDSAVKRLRTGFSGYFGFELETDWHLFNVLGLEKPDGFDSNLSLDFYSKRGPAIGVDLDYERDTYAGQFKSYLMTDDGRDNLGRKRGRPPRRDARGRVLLRHRHYLEDDWQLSLEISYISDKNFLEEFFEPEFDNDKEQETLIFLKKQRDTWAFTTNLQTRILDFTTQTERYPDLAFHVAGESLGPNVTWFSENRAGIVRYRPADQTIFDIFQDGALPRGSGSVMRADSRQEIGGPLDLGPVRVVPFGVVRGTAWDDSPRSGGVSRAFGMVGIRGSMYLSRTFPDVQSNLFDINGVRHIIKPDMTAWISESNRAPKELFPFDDVVERIVESDGVTIGVRQRWQTKRGSGENRRTVDFLTFDAEMGFFNDDHDDAITNGFASYTRPENSIARNYFNTSLIWRINDRTAMISEMNYDVNDGEIDVFNLSMVVERTPRLSYLIGYRYIEESNSNLLAFDLNYKLSEKHTLAIRELFDLQRGRTLDFTIGIIRKFPRWFGALSFELDDAEDDFGVSFSIWPEGIPQAALGSRRFTGLAGTTRIAND